MSSVDERIKSTGKGLKKKIVSVCKCAALIVKLASEILINLILGLWITSLTGNPWFTVHPWPSYDSLHISGNLRSLCLKKLKVKWQVEPVGKKAPERNSTLCISTTQSKDISGSPLKFFISELHKRMGLNFAFHYNAHMLLKWREVRTHGTILASIFCSPSTIKSSCPLFLYLALTASCTRQSFIRQWGTWKGALWTRLPVHKKCKGISQ